MRSLYSAVNCRRLGRSNNSGLGSIRAVSRSAGATHHSPDGFAPRPAVQPNSSADTAAAAHPGLSRNSQRERETSVD
jgi:hypothetical protein